MKSRKGLITNTEEGPEYLGKMSKGQYQEGQGKEEIIRKERAVSPAPGTEHHSLYLSQSRVSGVVGIGARWTCNGESWEEKDSHTIWGNIFFLGK